MRSLPSSCDLVCRKIYSAATAAVLLLSLSLCGCCWHVLMRRRRWNWSTNNLPGFLDVIQGLLCECVRVCPGIVVAMIRADGECRVLTCAGSVRTRYTHAATTRTTTTAAAKIVINLHIQTLFCSLFLLNLLCVGRARVHLGGRGEAAGVRN